VAFSLEQNVPNPFNPSTSISFELPERVMVELSIYDVEGRLVKRLASGIESPGTKTYRWDGRDNKGNPVASGVYVYKLQAGKQVLSRKMTLLR
jgi:flagellar hook assembly protein FlgD